MSKTDMSNQELRRIAEEATNGPWERSMFGSDNYRWSVENEEQDSIVARCNDRGNRDFIATFDPPTVLSLLDRVERLEEALRALILVAEDGDAHDEGAFDVDCHICVGLEAARSALSKASIEGEG